MTVYRTTMEHSFALVYRTRMEKSFALRWDCFLRADNLCYSLVVLGQTLEWIEGSRLRFPN